MSKHEGMYVVKHHPSPGVTLTIRQVATALGTAVVSMSIVGIVGTLDVPVPGLLKLLVGIAGGIFGYLLEKSVEIRSAGGTP